MSPKGRPRGQQLHATVQRARRAYWAKRVVSLHSGSIAELDKLVIERARVRRSAEAPPRLFTRALRGVAVTVRDRGEFDEIVSLVSKSAELAPARGSYNSELWDVLESVARLHGPRVSDVSVKLQDVLRALGLVRVVRRYVPLDGDAPASERAFMDEILSNGPSVDIACLAAQDVVQSTTFDLVDRLWVLLLMAAEAGAAHRFDVVGALGDVSREAVSSAEFSEGFGEWSQQLGALFVRSVLESAATTFLATREPMVCAGFGGRIFTQPAWEARRRNPRPIQGVVSFGFLRSPDYVGVEFSDGSLGG